jgi:RNA polymerase sigma factor for flagellar operon FliA
MLGLIQAADAFDKSRGLRFSTYAYPKIRGAILDELRRLDFLPRGRRERVRDLERAVAELEARNAAPPAPEEIAQALGIPIEELDELLLAARSAAHASLEGAPSEALLQMLSDPRSEDPVGSAEWIETKHLLERAIAELPEPEKTVITLYYGQELLLREIGEVLSVSESRVSQIQTRALYRLNATLTRAMGRAS